MIICGKEIVYDSTVKWLEMMGKIAVVGKALEPTVTK